ncbi:hypothetical protein [Enterococcus mundtii]|uniref:hypothetical protein n=1 Tax=Enterococcus mundtii TaxID=53346 RepID=UPI001156D3AC|nr:hypothetical protein [Enterococcus mundtii]
MLKRAIFPLYEKKSYLVTYEVDGVRYGMYVTAIDEASAKWQVNQRIPESVIVGCEIGHPSDREWEEQR